MKKTRIIYGFISVSLLVTLTAFTPKPQLPSYELRSSLSKETEKLPFTHDIQSNNFLKFKLNAQNQHFFEADESLQVTSENDYNSHFSIDAESVTLLTLQEKTELKNLGDKKMSHAFALPIGVSEIRNPLDFSIFHTISTPFEVQNIHYASTEHTSEPFSLAIYSDKNYITGSLCMPALPIKHSINPFFIDYKSLPTNLALQKQPIPQRANAYSDIVSIQARKYNLSSSLIYAIIHVESAFNPNAVSNMQAHGLMQIVLPTAGNDVHEYLQKTQPLRPDMLHNPETNIKYGTTYLHLLNTRHFQQITNRTSREYCMIAAYNGGSRRVLQLFGSGDAAFQAINELSPQEVYSRIRTSFPSPETRSFIQKVTNARNRYYAFKN